MRILTIISIPGTKLQQMSLGSYVTYEQALQDLNVARAWLFEQMKAVKQANQNMNALASLFQATPTPPPKTLQSTNEYLDEYIRTHNVKLNNDGSQELL